MYQQDPNVGAINALGRVAGGPRSLIAGARFPNALPPRRRRSPASAATGPGAEDNPLKPGDVARLRSDGDRA